MNLVDSRSTMTAEDFLLWIDSLSEGPRYELVAGEPVAMAPERNRHNLVKAECWLALRQAVRSAGIRCTVLSDGATVRVDEDNVYEPDVTVQCGEPIDLDATAATHPTILVEVLSPATKGVDSSNKLLGYFQLPSVQHYLVVDPAKRAVIHHYRSGSGIGTSLLHEGSLRLDPPGIDLEITDFFGALEDLSS
ncbi:MAG: Uma2 family endonuclease [Acidobacteriota bacterium]